MSGEYDFKYCSPDDKGIGGSASTPTGTNREMGPYITFLSSPADVDALCTKFGVDPGIVADYVHQSGALAVDIGELAAALEAQRNG